LLILEGVFFVLCLIIIIFFYKKCVRIERSYQKLFYDLPYALCLIQKDKIVFISKSLKKLLLKTPSKIEDLYKTLGITLDASNLDESFLVQYQGQIFDVIFLNHDVRYSLKILCLVPFVQNELYQSLLKSIHLVPDPIFAKDRNEKLIFFNKAYSHFLEESPQYIIENNTKLPEKNGFLNAHGKRYFFEYHEKLYKNFKVCYLKNLTKEQTLIQDIEIHKNHEKALLNHLSVAICIFDSCEYVQFCNTAFLKMFTLKENSLTLDHSMLHVLDLLRKNRKIPDFEDFTQYKKDKQMLFKSQIDIIQETWYLSDGKVIKLSITPYLVSGLVFFFEDISDKINLERGFNTMVAVQKETIDHLHEGILVIGNDYKIRLLNPSLHSILDIDTTGRHFNSLQPIFGTDIFQMIQTYISMRRPEKMECILNKKYLECSYVPLPDGSHLLCLTDISHRFLIEKSMKEKNLLLEQADHLKTEFISHISYEIKSPLNTIMGFLDILTQQYFGHLNERQLDYCKEIHIASQRLLNLVEDMIDLATIETGDLTLNYSIIYLDVFLKSVYDLLYGRAYDQGVEVIIDNQVTWSSFDGDDTCLKHILFNLFNHSMKFTLSGGHILLKVYEEPAGWINFSISDSGTHINFEEIKKVLEHDNYFREKSHTVLSLSLVKRLVKLHQGRIFLDRNFQIICQFPKEICR
jgi:signal transduction histidine kinase/PAS domain-containing protein